MSVREAFRKQGQICEGLGSPFMGRLMPLIGDRLTRDTGLGATLLDWPGDPTANADSVPLRFAGALHALKLNGLALRDVYPPERVSDNALWNAVEAAMVARETRLHEWMQNPPQTNEVRRAAVIMAALAHVADIYDEPVELLELGCSAGLNLRCDQFHFSLPEGELGLATSKVKLHPDWRGKSPTGQLPKVIMRRGVDLNPLDISRPEDRLRLLAYLWPDQPERLARTEAAMALAGEVPADIAQSDAGKWTEDALARPAPDRLRVLFHTVAWQYFPAETQSRALAAMRNSRSPLVRIGMEGDDGKGAAVTMTTWPREETRLIGRACFHGRWIEWHG